MRWAVRKSRPVSSVMVSARSVAVANPFARRAAAAGALKLRPVITPLMSGVITGLSFNAPAAAARLANGFATATDLAETITLETGLDFRTAHRIVGRLVREATQANRTKRDLTTADLDAAAQEMLNRSLHLSESAFAQALDPAA